MSDELASPTSFHTVKVTVVRNAAGTLQATYDKESTSISKGKSVISFQLVTAIDGIVFWGLDILPLTSDFGPPSINADGRLMTIDDDNRATKTYDVIINVFDPKYGVVPLDPQIINRVD